MGGGAVNIFNSKGINVFTGISGPIRAVAKEFAKGNIESSGSICSHTHSH
jgi:predicted Fe-Mo cluster-binding NifX family protein